MSWRDQLQDASFRGVPFFVNAHDRGGGRRLVKHEYPFQDVPYTEDMGRKGRSFKLDAFVVGVLDGSGSRSSYIDARDSLLDAIEAAGSGTLVHPYFGSLNVAVDEYSVQETSSDGGVAKFSVTFLETSTAPNQPATTPDPTGAVTASASASIASTVAQFLSAYNPGPIMDSVTGAITNALATASNAIAPLQIDTQDFALVNQSITNLQNNLTSVANSPGDLLSALQGVVSGFVAGTRAALTTLYSFPSGNRPPGTTADRQTEQTNFDAVNQLIQRLVIAQVATLVVGETFDSYDAAITAQTSITDLIDDQAENAADDTYDSLVQLRADVVKAVPGADSDLPRILSLTPVTTMPSLVLAYSLYGDVDSELDFVARNSIADPSQILGGVALEVLSDD